MGHLGTPHLAALELPTHMQLDGRCRMPLIASTAPPDLSQLIGQRHTTTIFQDHRAEAPQQLDRHVVGRLHHRRRQLFQHRM